MFSRPSMTSRSAVLERRFAGSAALATFVLTSALWMAGCTAPSQKFYPNQETMGHYGGAPSARDTDAVVSHESADALIGQGYVRLGEISRVVVLDTQWTTGEFDQNVWSMQAEKSADPTPYLCTEAAARGGDLFVPGELNKQEVRNVTKNGRVTATNSIQVLLGSVDERGMYHSRWVTQYVPIAWETIHGKEYSLRSYGTVWRHDPDLARRIAQGQTVPTFSTTDEESLRRKRQAAVESELSRGDAAWRANNLEDALAIYTNESKRLAGLEPDLQARVWLNLGALQHGAGRLDDAAASFQQGIAVPKTSAFWQVHLLLSRAGLATARRSWLEAITDYRAALQLAEAAPNEGALEATARNHLAEYLVSQEKYQEAAYHYQRTIDQTDAPDAERGRAANNLGDLEFRRGDLVRMRNALELAARLRPDDLIAAMNMALLLLLENKLEASLIAYRSVLASIADPEILRSGMLDVEFARGKYQLDAQACSQVLALFKSRVDELE